MLMFLYTQDTLLRFGEDEWCRLLVMSSLLVPGNDKSNGVQRKGKELITFVILEKEHLLKTTFVP